MTVCCGNRGICADSLPVLHAGAPLEHRRAFGRSTTAMGHVTGAITVAGLGSRGIATLVPFKKAPGTTSRVKLIPVSRVDVGPCTGVIPHVIRTWPSNTEPPATRAGAVRDTRERLPVSGRSLRPAAGLPVPTRIGIMAVPAKMAIPHSKSARVRIKVNRTRLGT